MGEDGFGDEGVCWEDGEGYEEGREEPEGFYGAVKLNDRCRSDGVQPPLSRWTWRGYSIPTE